MKFLYFQMLFVSDDNDTLAPDLSDWLRNGSRFYNDSDYDTTFDSDTLQCFRFDKHDNKLLNAITFWVDGVVNCLIASVGFFANVISALILGK